MRAQCPSPHHPNCNQPMGAFENTSYLLIRFQYTVHRDWGPLVPVEWLSLDPWEPGALVQTTNYNFWVKSDNSWFQRAEGPLWGPLGPCYITTSGHGANFMVIPSPLSTALGETAPHPDRALTISFPPRVPVNRGFTVLLIYHVSRHMSSTFISWWFIQTFQVYNKKSLPGPLHFMVKIPSNTVYLMTSSDHGHWSRLSFRSRDVVTRSSPWTIIYTNQLQYKCWVYYFCLNYRHSETRLY